MAIVDMKELIEAGVHFGARASCWNPKMEPYIFCKKNKVHIVDMRETLKGIIRAYKFLEDLTSQGKRIVFVGTKRQAQDVVRTEARRSNQYFVAQRWLGGTLTNIKTVRERVQRLDELDALEESGQINEFSKKMISQINREKRKITRNFEGIREMKDVPGALVLIDPRNEQIALAEALKLNIPVIALVDTDCDPDPIDFIIPGNDDGIRSINAIVSVLADACIAGGAKRSENVMISSKDAPAVVDKNVGAVSYGGDSDA
ncbi:MAG: 30S ribosomal protein S2 [Planctomycetota bacterium]